MSRKTSPLILTEYNENEENYEISEILKEQSSISPSKHMKSLSSEISQKSQKTSNNNADEESPANSINVQLSFNSECEELFIDISKESEENIHMDEDARESASKFIQIRKPKSLLPMHF